MALDPRMFLWYAINGVAAWTETAFFIVGIVCMMALMGYA
jgi:hypothetical protein